MTLPVPHDPTVPVPGPAAQAAALQQAVALSSARGWRVEGTAPGVATMVSGSQPNHVLHLLLTIFTCGLWAIVWIIIAVTSGQKRLTVVADLNGNVSYTQGAYPPPSPTPAPPTALGSADMGAAPAKKGMSVEKQLLLIGAGFAVLIGIGGIVTAIAHPSSTSTSTASIDTATTAAAPTMAAAPTTQAAPKPPSAGLALAAWWNGGAKDRAQAIGDDFGKIGTAAGSGNYPAIRAACSQAQADVEAAQAYGQVPDAQAQSLWAAALASYARASADCIAGIDTTNADLVSKSGDEINVGNTSMHNLAARIRELGSK